MKGNYTGTQTVLFNIRGKKMPAPKLKAHSRALKVTWKKQKAITGYQIQYSTNAKFKKSKTKIVKIAKGRQTSKFIKKLKARKKYYVRVRSYKTTKIGGKTYNAYSVWSKTKKGYREKVRNLYLSMTAVLCNSMEPPFLFFIKTQLICIFFLTFLLKMSRI